MEVNTKTRLARVLGSSGGRAAVRFTDNGKQANLAVTSASIPPIGSMANCKLLEIGWVVVGWVNDAEDEMVVKKKVDRNLRSVFC